LVVDWLVQNWFSIAVPLLVFLAFFMAAVWLRGVAYDAFDRWVAKARWEGSQLFVDSTRRPFLYWCLMLGAYIAVQVSVLSPEAKALAGRVLGSLFVISLSWVIARLSEGMLKLYLAKLKAPPPPTALVINIVRVTIAVVGVLILLDIWGAPTTPIILVLAAAIVFLALAFRDMVPDFFSGFQLAQGEHIKVGDFIKLESGDQGYVAEITWRNTRIKTLDGNLILIPNSRLIQSTVVNYGHPLKKASEPFRFQARLHLKELTGLRASNLPELVDILRRAPDSVIYYHTHHFLEEHQYLTPEPANDFALWVGDVLGDEVLSEKLASIDTFEFVTIGALKRRIIDVIDEYLAEKTDGRTAPEGREFHFIRSISVVLPTSYVAHDFREFVEILRKISIDSLYFHIFEAKLRLQKGVNDFSIWIEDCLEEGDLAAKIARLDPYTYTLEALRSTIIQLIEKRIK